MTTKQEKAYLDTIAWCEGTSTSKYTKNNGYDIIVDGLDSPKRFDDYSKHPEILVHVNGKLYSTAAGRYQLLKKYWIAYSKLLKLPDFSPASQDAIAIQQIRERRALDLINSGKIEAAVKATNNIWASLPGSPYGQRTRTMQEFIAKFKECGGTIA